MARRISEEKDLPIERVIELTLSGATAPGARHTPEDVERFRTQVFDVLSSADSTVHRGVYIVNIFDPSRRISYHTLCIDGRMMYKQDDDGRFAFDNLHDSLDPLLKAIAGEGVPVQTQTVRRGNGGNKQPPHGRRDKPLNRFDPSLLEYLTQRAPYFSYAAFDAECDASESVRTLTAEEVEHCLPGIAARVKARGLDVRAETPEQFVKRHKDRIVGFRREYVNELLMQPEVTLMAAGFMAYMSGHAEGSDAYVVNRNNARPVYEWFKSNNTTRHKVDNLLVSIRDLIINKYVRAAEAVRSNVLDTTAKWVAFVKAAEFLENDPVVKQDVVSAFTPVDDVPLDERTFEGVRRLAERVLVKRTHSLGEYKFMIRGLWMLGQLRTAHQTKKYASLSTTSDERLRDSTGSEVEYVLPVSHLLARWDKYDPLMKQTFDGLPADQKKIASLGTRNEYTALARLLYDTVPADVRQQVFVHLYNDDIPLKQSSGHFIKILQFYVGVNRDYFLARSREHGQS
ncbi:hypothetical protein HY490_02335 [Candidatus Woesearchaeota archaeon]|nr:hypothetical protein [Candidatus Woesearchaeota archaeon]